MEKGSSLSPIGGMAALLQSNLNDRSIEQHKSDRQSGYQEINNKVY
jgi:hypothetical protein